MTTAKKKATGAHKKSTGRAAKKPAKKKAKAKKAATPKKPAKPKCYGDAGTFDLDDPGCAACDWQDDCGAEIALSNFPKPDEDESPPADEEKAEAPPVEDAPKPRKARTPAAPPPPPSGTARVILKVGRTDTPIPGGQKFYLNRPVTVRNPEHIALLRVNGRYSVEEG